MDRRKVLALVVHGGGLTAAGVVGVPAVITALSPVIKPRRDAEWRIVGPLDEFPIGEVYEGLIDPSREAWPRSVSPQTVYVWRPAADEVVVFSRSCTDLGCPLTFDVGSQCFFCPCHGGIFDKEGQRMAGPPSRPMYRYATRVREGVLEVDLTSLPPMT